MGARDPDRVPGIRRSTRRLRPWGGRLEYKQVDLVQVAHQIGSNFPRKLRQNFQLDGRNLPTYAMLGR